MHSKIDVPKKSKWLIWNGGSTILKMSEFSSRRNMSQPNLQGLHNSFCRAPYKGTCLNLTSLFKLDATRKMQYRLFYLKQISYSVQVRTMSLPRTLKPETFFNVQALILILTRIAWTYSKRTAKKNKYQPKNNNS